MNWSSPHLKCLLFSFHTAATHCDTTGNMGESSGWRHDTKPQHWKKERIQIHMTDHRMSHVAAVLSSTTLKFPVKHLRMLCQPQSPLLFENWSVPLSCCKDKEQKRCKQGLQWRSEPSEAQVFVCTCICQEVQLIMQHFLKLILLSYIYFFIFDAVP